MRRSCPWLCAFASSPSQRTTVREVVNRPGVLGSGGCTTTGPLWFFIVAPGLSLMVLPLLIITV